MTVPLVSTVLILNVVLDFFNVIGWQAATP
jgi:hypothetical protein